MALSIKDPKTDKLARRVSSITGESITEAIQHSLEERLKNLEAKNQRSIDWNRVKEIQKRVKSLIPKGIHSLDHGEILYGRDGLPK